MCIICFENRHKKRKKQKRGTPIQKLSPINLTALEQRTKRYLIQERYDEAIPSLHLLIEELRAIQQFEKADILEMTLNQLKIEHPEYFEK